MNEALFAEPTISQPLPHSTEAEQAVIGGLMLKNDAFDSVSEILSDRDFYNKDHQLIFNAMLRLAAEEQPFDPITLADLFKILMNLLLSVALNTLSTWLVVRQVQLI